MQIKKPITLLVCACLLEALAGCSSAGKDASASAHDVISKLEKLETGATVSQIQDAFNTLLERTASIRNWNFQIEKQVSEDAPILQSGEIEVVSNTQDSISSYWLETGNLYEALRMSATNTSEGYIVLIHLDQDFTQRVNCYVNDQSSPFAANPDVTINFMETIENKTLRDASQLEVQNGLLREEYLAFTDLVGSMLAIAPYADPSLYSFDLHQEDDCYLFTYSLSNADAYNKQAENQNRSDLLQDTSIDVENYQTTEISYTLTISVEGAIEAISGTSTDTFEYGNQICTLNKRINGRVSSASNKDLGVMKDVFEQIDDASLRLQSSFILELSQGNIID